MASIAAGFDKIVALTGNGSKFIRVNAGATAQEAVSATGSGSVVLATGATISTPTISGATISAPAVSGGTVDNCVIGGVTPAAGTFTSITATSGTIGGSAIVTLAGSQTLTNKTIVGASIGSGTLDNTVITGSTLNSTVVGGGTPAAGTFTTLTATGTLAPQALLDISGASAGQIKFPATQNASANANTLDDYEEGTWTPALTCVTPGNLTPNYFAREGDYTKIGNRVYVNFRIIAAPTQTTASGALQITGLPFANGAIDMYFPCLIGNFDLAGTTGQPLIAILASSSTIFLGLSPLNSGYADLTVAKFTSGTTITIYGSLQYATA